MKNEREGDGMNRYYKQSCSRDRIVYIHVGERRGKLRSELEGKIFEQSSINSVTPNVFPHLRRERHLKRL